MTVAFCVYLSCDNDSCMIAVVVPIKSLTMPEDLCGGDVVKPSVPANYQGWLISGDTCYCPWCKGKSAKC